MGLTRNYGVFESGDIALYLHVVVKPRLPICEDLVVVAMVIRRDSVILPLELSPKLTRCSVSQPQ